MRHKNVLAFDFGASSGRAMLASFDGEKINMTQIHRFSNDPVEVNGTFYWDIMRLFFEIKQGIAKALAHAKIDAIGIDTWGVDFALIDEHGQMLKNPVHYRDERTYKVVDEVFELISKNEIYEESGIQFLHFNTLYQLYYMSKYEPEILALAKNILMTPDLLAYFLTGQMRSELTIASTSNLIDPRSKTRSKKILSALNIDERLFPPMIKPGEIYGTLSDKIASELGCDNIPVIAVATHDTASAVVGAPSKEEDFVYLSSGTWSLFGIESDDAIITKESQKANFTNELGYGGKVRFLKNIMGLWLIQESRRQFIREGDEVSFDKLEQEAQQAAPLKCFIDCDAKEFETPGNIPRRIKEYCKKTGQYVPESRGEIMRCIYDSLALKYKSTFMNLQEITNKNYTAINIVGGGINAKLLCKLCADACKVKVFAGPSEATVMGNIAVGLIALGEISDLKKAREVIRNSVDICEYLPSDGDKWDETYYKYKQIIGEV